MLSWLLSFIPVIGKGFDAVSSYFNKKQDVDLEKYKVDGQVNVEAMHADIALIQAQKELRLADKGDLGVRVAMWLFLIPSGIYYTAYMWDSTFRNVWPDYTWRVLTPEEGIWKILMIIVGYLFLSTVKQAWRR
jgi:hypothetical protein